MGCYDTVRFKCPDCKAAIENQSKAGPCNLNVYGRYSVPLPIAGCMDGDVLECAGCAKQWRVRVDAPVTVPLALEAYQADEPWPY